MIRDATRADAEAITAVHAAGWRAGYGAFFEAEALEEAIVERSTRWTNLLNKADLGEALLLVAEEAGQIIAFVHAGPADEYPNAIMIYSFYVHPDHWGTGVAFELMHAILGSASAAGHQSAYLTAYSKSARARRFYEKVGFRETGRTIESHLPRRTVVIDVEYVYDLMPAGSNSFPSIE